jgi:CO/xanthine dehydrogenase FAD-binding subunit
MFGNVEAFYRPATVAEALGLLEKAKGHGRVVAGGTDLVVAGGDSVRVLIDITRAGLSYIRSGKGGIHIGATTTMAEVESSPLLRKLANGLLCRAAATCGSIEIRNRATVGGNLANGSPAADLATPLLVLDGEVVRVGRGLVTEIVIPELPRSRRRGWSFQKMGRTAVDLSVVNVAVGLELDARRRVKWARIALGAVAAAPFRAGAAEQRMTGRVLDRALLAEVGEAIPGEVQPITDQRASAKYRREMACVLAERAIEECAGQAGFSL